MHAVRVSPSTPIQDRALVARAAAGDPAAFAALVSALHRTAFRWALGITGDADEADDVAQDAFVRMHRKLAQYDGDAPLEAWLYRIVRRVAAQRLRTRQRRARLSAPAADAAARDAYLTDPGARVDRQRLVADAYALLAALPPRQRETFDLVDLQGYDPLEVALMTATNPSTVRANLFKARAAVRARLLARHPHALEAVR